MSKGDAIAKQGNILCSTRSMRLKNWRFSNHQVNFHRFKERNHTLTMVPYYRLAHLWRQSGRGIVGSGAKRLDLGGIALALFGSVADLPASGKTDSPGER